MIESNHFGKNGPAVTRVGLGGEGVLRTWGREEEARSVIETALAEGLTYYDCAAAYAGSQGYYGLVWGDRPGDREKVFQASKSAERSAAGAANELEDTLATMKTDHLDLWQIHDVRTETDLAAVEGPGGALEAFVKAKEQGKTRFIGVTGHHDPAILTRAVKNWPVDAVMLPVNPVEATLGGFLTETLPAAREKGLAVIAMKVLGASYYIAPGSGVGAEDLIGFALAQPVTVVIVGCKSPAEVGTLAAAGRAAPMPQGDQDALVEKFAPQARRLGFYRGV